MPLLVAGLERRKVLKISTHVDGSHYLALMSDGSVYSWGCGDSGQLGHGNFRLCFLCVYLHILSFKFKLSFSVA